MQFMYEIMIRKRTLPEAYHLALTTLRGCWSKVPAPAWGTNRYECGLTMQITEPLSEPMISKMWVGGPSDLEQYRLEILDGILDFEVEHGNWSYTYHLRIASQIPFVIETLKKDPYSTRAVINVRTPEESDIDNDHPACLNHIQYFIRNGKLECDVLFRSNDAWEATFMNSFGLIMLQKSIADRLNVEVGSYTLRANSFHVYEKNFEDFDKAVNKILTSKVEDLTYSYINEWKELMDEYRPMIMDKVKVLKERAK